MQRRWEASDPEAARRGNAVAYGRVALLLVGGVVFVQGIVYGLIGESLPIFAFCAAIGACMIALFFWGRARPLAALITGSAVYLGLQALAAVISPVTLVQGLLSKIVVVMALAGGIGAELHRRKLQRESAARRAG